MITVRTYPPTQSLLDVAIDEWGSGGGEGAALIFPNRRAITHLGHRWAQRGCAPALLPSLMTMEGLAARLAGMEEDLLCDMDAVALLRDAVHGEAAHPLATLMGNFSTFYPWGSAFVRTLDEMDREGVASEDVARNLGFPAFERCGKEALAFLQNLPKIRKAFHEKMAGQSMTTRGYRLIRALERVKGGGSRVERRVVFVGPFALTGLERSLITALGRDHEVDILLHHDGRPWPMIQAYEALNGRHLESPGPLRFPALDFHAAPSRHGMIAACREVLHNSSFIPGETAVVMPESSLLVPFLYEVMSTLSVPYNVTMGYPLARSPILTLFAQILKVVRNMRDPEIEKRSYITLIHHPLIKSMDFGVEPADFGALLNKIETKLLDEPSARFTLDLIENQPFLESLKMRSDVPMAELKVALSKLHGVVIGEVSRARTLSGAADGFESILKVLLERSSAHDHPLFNEFFRASASMVERMKSLIVSSEIVDDRSLLVQMISTFFKEEMVPFSGVPLEGLQIMGLLETRVLTFDNIYVLSLNEGILPTSHSPDPILPAAFRKALGMPGPKEREAIFKYHLFRLIEAGKNVHLFSVDNHEESRSHFVEELLYDMAQERGSLEEREPKVYGFNVLFPGSDPVLMEKSPAAMARIEEMTFSSHALDTYLACPFSFAQHYILGLKESRIGRDDGALMAGTLLHRVMEKIYAPHLGDLLTDEVYEAMQNDLDTVLERVIGKRGKQRLLALLARGKITAFLKGESERTAGRVRLEAVEKRMDVNLLLSHRTVRLTGILDRLDERGGEWVIVDYKSGSDLKRLMPGKGDLIPGTDRRSIGTFLHSTQFPLYAILLHEEKKIPFDSIQVEAISLRGGRDPFLPLFKRDEDRADRVQSLYLPMIEAVIEEILDPATPFAADPLDERRCEGCPYTALCRRI